MSEGSVRSENAAMLAEECPFVRFASLLGTHWRPALIWKIGHGTQTYNALRRSLTGITDKMLSTELIALTRDGLVAKIELSAMPRRSRYVLTARGASIVPVLEGMQCWATADRAHAAPDRQTSSSPTQTYAVLGSRS